MRIVITALALCALFFVAGVAGDLSTTPANAGATVTLRLPPPIAADAPRAAPLPRLIATPSAMAAQPRQAPAARAERPAPAESRSREAKPLASHHLLAALPKVDQATLTKAKERKQG